MGDWLTDLAARSLGAAPTARPTPRIYAGGPAPLPLDFPREPIDDPLPIEAVLQTDARPAPLLSSSSSIAATPSAEGPAPAVHPARLTPRSDPAELGLIRAEPQPPATARRAVGPPPEDALAPTAAPRQWKRQAQAAVDGEVDVAIPTPRAKARVATAATAATPTPHPPDRPSVEPRPPAPAVVPRRREPDAPPEPAARIAPRTSAPRERPVMARPAPSRREEGSPPVSRPSAAVTPPVPPPAPPSITVTIGRIEIRAAASAPRRSAPAEPAGRALERYLSGERRGGPP